MYIILLSSKYYEYQNDGCIPKRFQFMFLLRNRTFLLQLWIALCTIATTNCTTIVSMTCKFTFEVMQWATLEKITTSRILYGIQFILLLVENKSFICWNKKKSYFYYLLIYFVWNYLYLLFKNKHVTTFCITAEF